MPATAGRVRMPANNRVHSSAALQTHGIWQSAIGYDPYAPTNKEKDPHPSAPNPNSSGADVGAADDENAYASFQGLLALARITGSNADETRGSCKKCGRVGHLTFQCRNFLSAVDKEDEENGGGSALRTATAVFNKIRKGGKKDGAEDSDEDEDDDDEESESSDSDVNPEIEKIIAARMGKMKKKEKKESGEEKRRGRSKTRSSKKRSKRSEESDDDKERRKEKRKRRHRSSDDDDEEGDRRRKSRKEKSRRRSHHRKKSDDSSDGDSEEDRRRHKRKSEGRRKRKEDSEGSGGSDEERSRARRKKKAEERSRNHRRDGKK